MKYEDISFAAKLDKNKYLRTTDSEYKKDYESIFINNIKIIKKEEILTEVSKELIDTQEITRTN